MERMPAYLSCASVARELDVAESTVNDMVRRGILPKPYKMSAGCVRWKWAEVELALASLKAGTHTVSDPYLAGAQHATNSQQARGENA
jgi:predicted DNA-binding transcriptional regulator AlpA